MASSVAPPMLVRAVLFSCLTVVTSALPPRVAPQLDIESNSSSPSPSPSPPLTTINVTPMQRNALFWTATAIAVLVSIIQGAITTLADICEAEGLWTIRFRLGAFEQLWWTGIATALATSLATMIISFLAGNTGESLGILVLSTASSLAVFRYAWPAWRNRHYCRNRWMAWTGPSRTGIEGALVPYIGGPEEWKILNSTSRIARMHPVEKRVRHRANYIAADPTDLLKSAHASNRPHATLLSPKTTEKGLSTNGEETAAGTPIEKSSRDIRSSELTVPPPPNSALSLSPKEGRSSSFRMPPDVYAPVAPGESASLLWGAHLGFAPRVSRGILSIPQRLLASNPRTEADHDGRAMCLAHGILARNKGLAPKTFILDIALNKLEEKSVQWPRPSKVLRSYYKKEFTSMYGGLGDAFVDTATELALLLADSHYHIVSDWLYAHLEHQDIRLNRQLYELGASSEDLQLLYRLSYAAMLVSLSSHVLGHHLRPEMSVFTTYVTRVQERELPAWTNGVAVQARLVAERTSLTTDLDALIEAVLPPFRR